MKIIFLDIDGVLNSQIFYSGERKKIKKRSKDQDKLDYHKNQIDGTAIQFLNSLIAETGAKVVISSTWRMGSTLEYLQQLFKEKGFTGEIIDFTPIHRESYSLHGNEIYQWIGDNSQMLCNSNSGSDFKEYVIFDDDSDMLYWQRNNYIKVDAYIGLTPNQCYQAKFILCPDMTFGRAHNLTTK